MKRAFVMLLGAVSLAGCAGVQTADTRAAEQALTAAGFEARPADTPEKLAQLRSLTPRKVLMQTQEGEPQYVYADPAQCQCLYVGGEAQYQQLRRQQQQVVDRFFAVEGTGDRMDWGVWQIGPR